MKKEYIKPSVDVISMEESVAILAASGYETDTYMDSFGEGTGVSGEAKQHSSGIWDFDEE